MGILSGWKFKAIFYTGLFLTFLKTGEAMTLFAPRSVFGLTHPIVLGLWAYLGAALVEGTIVTAYQVLTTPRKDRATKTSAAIAGLLAIVYSGAMNLVDQSITEGTLLLDSGDQLVRGLRSAVTLIPLAIPVILAMIAVVDLLVADRAEIPAPRPSRQPEQPYRVERPQEHRLPAPAMSDSSEAPRLNSPQRSPVNAQKVDAWRPQAEELRRVGPSANGRGGDQTPL